MVAWWLLTGEDVRQDFRMLQDLQDRSCESCNILKSCQTVIGVTIVKLSYLCLSSRVLKAILVAIMNRKLLLLVISVCLSAASASAQLPGPDAVAALRSAKTIYVKSSSVLVGASVVETKLQKRPEFAQMGLVITRDESAADLILELEHDVFTKYVYTAIDRKTNIVVASGKLSSLGGTVAGKVAKRFLKQMLQARATAAPSKS